jgi:MFS family permease
MRLLVGVGIGGVPIVFSMYLELVPTESRGFWAALIQVWWSVGTMGVAGMAWAILESPGWRWLVGFVSIPLALLTVLYWLLAVESPRYYVDQGLIGRAEETLRIIAAINGKTAELGHLRLRDSAKPLAANSPLLAPADDGESSPAAPHAASAGDAGPAAADGVLVKSGALPDPAGAAAAGPDGKRGVSALRTPSSSARSSRGDAEPQRKETYGAFDDGPAGTAGASGGRPRASSADGALEDPAGGSGRSKERGLSCGACFSMVATTGDALGELVSEGHLRTSVLLWMLWFGNALGYYGLVLLSTEIRVSAPSGDGESCKGQQVHLSNDDFMSIFIDSAAELPGLILAALIADRLGRRWSQALGFGVAGLACAILVFVPVSLISLWYRSICLFICGCVSVCCCCRAVPSELC